MNPSHNDLPIIPVPADPPRSHPRRRGSIYLVATSGLVMVAGVGLAAMAILRADHATHLGINETSELRLLAQGGLELAVQRMTDEPDWRDTVDPITGWTWSIAGADIAVIPTDPVDGNLTDDVFDEVILTAWATRGDARQGASVRFEMLENGGPTLALALASTGNIETEEADPVQAGEPIYTRGSFTATEDSRIEGNVFASGSIFVSGSSQINGTIRPNISTLDFPDPARAFETWIARATPIDPSLLESSYRMAGVTLSSTENPYGPPNPDGIYHIHASRPSVLIEDVTIVGTLIVTGVSDDIDLRGAIDASPIDPASPVLMLQGGRADLRNATNRLTINGLVFIEGDLSINTGLNAAGPIIVLGGVTINDAPARFAPTGAVAAAPPEGFSTDVVPAIIDQSWIRAID